MFDAITLGQNKMHTSENTTIKLNILFETTESVDRLDSNPCRKFVICENCLHSDSICTFYDAHRYCVECLCDHACCPECSSGYHAIMISD
jgi:hypothetical protein